MFAVDEILPESFLALFKKIYFLVMTHVELGGGEGPPNPPPRGRTVMHLQKDGDSTKHVVTPFGTRRLV